MNVRLPTALEEFIRRKIAAGEFNSPDEVVAEGLRALQQQEHWIAESRRKIDEGWIQAQVGETRSNEQVRSNLAERKDAWKRSPTTLDWRQS